MSGTVRGVVGALVAATVAAGCTVGPNYQRPVVPVPDRWRDTAAAAGAAGDKPSDAAARPAGERSLAELDWWTLFRDPVLQGLIREALVGNKDLLLAAARVQEARALLGVTRADQFPQVTAGVDASRSRASAQTAIPFGPTTANNDFRVGGDLSFELDLWGRLRRATEAARASLVATEEGRAAVQLALVRSVAQAYFELRDLDLQLEVATRARGTREASLDLATARRRGGLTSDLDVQQATAELANARAVIANLDLQIGQKENALNLLLGRNPGSVARGAALTEQATLTEQAARMVPVSAPAGAATAPASQPPPAAGPAPAVAAPEVPVGLPSALLERRPDIRSAEQELVAANAAIGVAKAAYFPRIALTGALGFESAELSNLLTRSAGLWSVAGNAAAPVFNAGRTRHNVEAAKARHEQAVVLYAQTVQQAFREVEDALIAYRKTRDVQDAQETQVAAARESVRLAEVRYRGGVSTYLDVLDSQRQLLNAELQLSQTRRAHLVSLVQLYGALGGGWKS